MDMDGMSTGHGGSACRISMLWNWYTTDACFLSATWHIRSDGMMAGSCIGVMLLTVLLELLRRAGKEYDALILRRFRQSLESQSSAAAATDCSASDAPMATGARTATFRPSLAQQAVRASIHAVTFGVAYIIMLLAMYFNGYIIISIFVGAGVGKFGCDWAAVEVALDSKEDRGQSGGVDETTVCCG